MNLNLTTILQIGLRMITHRREIERLWPEAESAFRRVSNVWPEIERAINATQAIAPQVYALAQKIAPEFFSATPLPAPAFDVRWVQQSLNTLDNAGLVVDGIYGPRTKAAIQNFQTRTGLDADGWVGPITTAKILELLPKS